ncbi:TPA: phage protein NinX family protein [Enterobacter ludwigii]
MDYSQLSDFEINKIVAIATGHKKFNDLGWQGTQEGNYSSVIVKGPIKIGGFDPCNNAADAWPIIVGNDISLNSYGSAWEASFEHDAPIGAFGTDETVTSGYEHRNPLRAAMIAFLMKQEHANA